jgi:hypothetical protein
MESAVRSPRAESAITTNHARNVAFGPKELQYSPVPDPYWPSKPCYGERNFWMQRLEAKNRPERPQGSSETERVERYRRKSPQKRPIGSRRRDLRFRRTGWWARQGSNLRPPPSCVRSTQMRTLSNSWRRRTRWLIADLRYVMWDCDAATATTPPKKRKIT